MIWAKVVFWSADLLVSFRTGFYNGLELVMCPRRIAASYLRRWFVFDFLLLVQMVVSLILDGNNAWGAGARRTMAFRISNYVLPNRPMRDYTQRSLLVRWHIVKHRDV